MKKKPHENVVQAGLLRLKNRTERLARLVALDAPLYIVATEVLMILDAVALADPTALADAYANRKASHARQMAGFCADEDCGEQVEHVGDLCAACAELDSRPAIQRKPGVCGGRACVADTRIPVWTLARMWRDGASDEQVLAAYPSLTPGHLIAAQAYIFEHAEEIRRDMSEQDHN